MARTARPAQAAQARVQPPSRKCTVAAVAVGARAGGGGWTCTVAWITTGLILAGKTPRLLRRFILKLIIMPRQARDKHRENTKRERRVFLQQHGDGQLLLHWAGLRSHDRAVGHGLCGRLRPGEHCYVQQRRDVCEHGVFAPFMAI